MSSIYTMETSTASQRYRLVSKFPATFRFATKASLGMTGLVVWLIATFTGFVMFGTLLILQSRTQPSMVAAAGYQPQSLFAAVPKMVTLFGYTQGADDPRAAQLERFLLTRRSPMTGSAQTFIEVADNCPMDWTLLPAIAGKESSFGLYIPRGSYNAFGWAVYTGQNHGAVFGSWDDAIRRVGEGLCENYIKNGRNTPETIEPLYTPLSAATHGGWRTDVKAFMEMIRTF